MTTQFLFTYGTLKSDQPEHSQHCIPPLSITKAKAPGTLWKLREGYPILQIEPEMSLLDATHDLSTDWQKAAKLASKESFPDIETNWIDGELFEYPLEENILHKMDTWENFVPGIKSTYQRRIIWTKDSDGRDRIAWAYVCYSPPNWATMLSEKSWNS